MKKLIFLVKMESALSHHERALYRYLIYLDPRQIDKLNEAIQEFNGYLQEYRQIVGEEEEEEKELG